MLELPMITDTLTKFPQSMHLLLLPVIGVATIEHNFYRIDETDYSMPCFSRMYAITIRYGCANSTIEERL